MLNIARSAISRCWGRNHADPGGRRQCFQEGVRPCCMWRRLRPQCREGFRDMAGIVDAKQDKSGSNHKWRYGGHGEDASWMRKRVSRLLPKWLSTCRVCFSVCRCLCLGCRESLRPPLLPLSPAPSVFVVVTGRRVTEPPWRTRWPTGAKMGALRRLHGARLVEWAAPPRPGAAGLAIGTQGARAHTTRI